VHVDDTFPLHADLELSEITLAVRSRAEARIVLATSLAEVAMTIADVDVVLDSGLSRYINSDDELKRTYDYASPPTVNQQREGRAGRTKEGRWWNVYRHHT
jgi:HrpA-like RNA helicase